MNYVDAQATLGEGVVVQVSGELSNDGQPMRRFTQTFVLACQSPKKYYVHNDIFRYQDIYTEDEDSGRGEGLDEDSDQATVESPNQGAVLVQQQVPAVTQQTAVVQQAPQGTVYYATGPPQAIIPNYVASPTQPAQVNGVVHDDILKTISTQTSNMPVAQQTPAPIPVVSPQPIPAMPVAVQEPVIAPNVVPVQQVVIPADQIIPAVIPQVVSAPQVVSQQTQSGETNEAPISQPTQQMTYVAEVEAVSSEEVNDASGDAKDNVHSTEKSDQRVNDSRE